MLGLAQIRSAFSEYQVFRKRYTISSRAILLDNIVLVLRLNYVKKVNIKRYKRSLFFFHVLPLSNEKRFNETQPYFI